MYAYIIVKLYLFQLYTTFKKWVMSIYTEPKSNLLYKLKTLMKSLILFLIQYSALAIIKKV